MKKQFAWPFLLIAVLILSSCDVFAANTADITGTEVPAGSARTGTIWQDNFGPGPRWQLATDTIGCEEFPVTLDDVAFRIEGNALVMESNVRRQGGLFANAIAYRPFEWQGDGYYMLSGAFMVPDGSEVEFINAALEFVVDGVGHYAEIAYELNPYTDRYGWTWTRTLDHVIVGALYAGTETNKWHTFELLVYVDYSDDVFQIVSITVDDSNPVEIDVEMVEVEKPWDSSTQVLIETHNMFPNCDGSIVTHGVSIWDSITISKVNP